MARDKATACYPARVIIKSIYWLSLERTRCLSFADVLKFFDKDPAFFSQTRKCFKPNADSLDVATINDDIWLVILYLPFDFLFLYSEAVLRVRKWSRSNVRDKLIQDFLLGIFRIHEQFAAGEHNQSVGRFRYLYKM